MIDKGHYIFPWEEVAGTHYRYYADNSFYELTYDEGGYYFTTIFPTNGRTYFASLEAAKAEVQHYVINMGLIEITREQYEKLKILM
jgi:hypothetical protein